MAQAVSGPGPIVSCIMPISSRHPREMVDRAVDSFNALELRPTELISIRDAIWRGASVGELRNACIRRALGSVIAHWDSDDVSSPDRLARSLAEIKAGADLVGSSLIRYVEPATKRAWLYDGAYAGKDPWLAGGTYVYRRTLWERHNFDLWLPQGEDTEFLNWARENGAKVVDLRDADLYTATIHPGNTGRKHPVAPAWTQIQWEERWA